jgi:hypothetical protein
MYHAFTLVQNWVRIPIIISLDIVLEGLGNDNLTKFIMETLTIGGGCQKIIVPKTSFVLG